MTRARGLSRWNVRASGFRWVAGLLGEAGSAVAGWSRRETHVIDGCDVVRGGVLFRARTCQRLVSLKFEVGGEVTVKETPATWGNTRGRLDVRSGRVSPRHCATLRLVRRRLGALPRLLRRDESETGRRGGKRKRVDRSRASPRGEEASSSRAEPRRRADVVGSGRRLAGAQPRRHPGEDRLSLRSRVERETSAAVPPRSASLSTSTRERRDRPFFRSSALKSLALVSPGRLERKAAKIRGATGARGSSARAACPPRQDHV